MARFRMMSNGKVGDHHGGAFGIDMQDGTKYRPETGRFSGTVDVDRPDHVAAIKRSAAVNQYDALKEVSYGMGQLVTVRCPGCFFAPWSEQIGEPCPKCGTPLEKEI